MPRRPLLDKSAFSQAAEKDSKVIQLRANAKRGTHPDAKALASMPVQRKVMFNPSAPFYGTPFIPDHRSPNEAVNAQIVGETQGSACDKCRDDDNISPGLGTGRFVGCVVAEKPDGTKYFKGACASCHFDDNSETCSFVTANGHFNGRIKIALKVKGSKLLDKEVEG